MLVYSSIYEGLSKTITRQKSLTHTSYAKSITVILIFPNHFHSNDCIKASKKDVPRPSALSACSGRLGWATSRSNSPSLTMSKCVILMVNNSWKKIQSTGKPMHANNFIALHYTQKNVTLFSYKVVGTYLRTCNQSTSTDFIALSSYGNTHIRHTIEFFFYNA